MEQGRFTHHSCIKADYLQDSKLGRADSWEYPSEESLARVRLVWREVCIVLAPSTPKS
jgi:hypothetical protein